MNSKVKEIILSINIKKDPLPASTPEEEKVNGKLTLDLSSPNNDYLVKIRNIYKILNHGKQSKFKKMFGQMGPFWVIRRIIEDYINETFNFEEVAEIAPLKDLLGEKIDFLSEKITQEILSFPKKYIIFIKLPSFSDQPKSFNFTDSFKIVPSDPGLFSAHQLPEKRPAGGLTKALTFHLYSKDMFQKVDFWSDNSHYLTITDEGYLPDYGASNFEAVVENNIYGFLGLAVSMLLLEERRDEAWFLGEILGNDNATPYYFPVFDLSEETNPVFINWLSLPNNVGKLIRSLITIESPHSQSWLKAILTARGEQSEAGDIGRELFNSARWLFDSMVEKSPTHAFVQSIIGIEMLLGEFENTQNLTQRLADRYAYALSEGPLHRDLIRNDFIEFYKLRSRIVHSGRVLLPDLEEDEEKVRMAKQYFKILLRSESIKFCKQILSTGR